MNRVLLVNAPRVTHADLKTKHGADRSGSERSYDRALHMGASPERYVPIVNYIETCSFCSVLPIKCIL